MSTNPLFEHRTRIASYGNDLFRISGVELAKTSEKQWEACGVFLGGIVLEYGRVHHLTAPEIHALVVFMLMDVLEFSPEQAGTFSSQLIHVTQIQATTAGLTAIKNGIKNSIIDRGVDGYRQLSTNDNDGLRQNLLGFFESLGEPYTL